jgi:hypothetical protein
MNIALYLLGLGPRESMVGLNLFIASSFKVMIRF